MFSRPKMCHTHNRIFLASTSFANVLAGCYFSVQVAKKKLMLVISDVCSWHNISLEVLCSFI
jgi:hypothetical protein